MKLESRVLGSLETNCYLLWREEDGRGIVIDPGADEDETAAWITACGVRPEAVLLTHGHFDHILAADGIRKKFGIPIVVGRKEEALLADSRENLSGVWSDPVTLKADRFVQEGDLLSYAGLAIRVLETPGHTPGGVCYYLEKEKLLFSGDTLFYRSYGRTDFPGGSMSELTRSVTQKLFVLPEDVSVFPGHGEETDIGFEKKYNPLSGMLS